MTEMEEQFINGKLDEIEALQGIVRRAEENAVVWMQRSTERGALVRQLVKALQEQQMRLMDFFDRHERPSYHAGSDPDSDLDLILATGREAIAKAEELCGPSS